ncbi:MAG: serine/threonine-protein phosphatase [Kofleriaceae bacterium]|nr:serine/threonine-protein phosphatase [Kofleriaceae bacterium]MBP9206606.1 serine/threonine-protein phosphatase [Kofleriaceae bacterium]
MSVWSATDPGRRRERNEDALLVEPGLGLVAVADGMGGHQGGAIASRLALDVLARRIRTPLEKRGASFADGDTDPAVATLSAAAARVTEPMEAVDPMLDGPAAAAAAIPSTLRLLRTAAADAGAAVYQASLGDPTLSGMGTTLTAALYDGDKLHLIHAGDSRCYLFRDGALRQLTDDHTWIAEQVRTGAMTEAEAKESRFRHVITRSIGFERQIDVDTRSLVVEPGDCLVLCSDGMSNYIDGLELERLVATTWYRKLPQLLVDAANQRGGDDNITVVVALFSNHVP